MDELTTCIREAEQRARESGGRLQDREDLVQETLLRVWRRLRRKKRRGSLAALVRRTLSGILVDRLRRNRLQPEEENELAAPDASPIEWAEAGERRARVRRAIEALPGPQREVVRLRYYEGLKYREIAAAKGVPLNTVLGRMHLAAGRLRRALEDHDD